MGDLAHKSAECAGRLRLWESPNVMLLPAILQILDQSQIQSKKAVKNVESGFEAEMTARQSLEELLRIITKFQKSNQKRVVDVFE
jgi:hypothetical protein